MSTSEQTMVDRMIVAIQAATGAGLLDAARAADAALQAIREADVATARAGMDGVRLRSPTVTWALMIDAVRGVSAEPPAP